MPRILPGRVLNEWHVLLGREVMEYGRSTLRPSLTRMNEKTRSAWTTALLIVAGLALGTGAIAYLKPDRMPGYLTGDYTRIQESIGSEVLLFTIPGCDYCAMAREWLSSNHPEFREVSLAQHPEYRKELQDLTQLPGVPITIIGDTLITGYNKDHLIAALQKYREER